MAGHHVETEVQICLKNTKQTPQLPQVSNFAAQFNILKSSDTFFTGKLESKNKQLYSHILLSLHSAKLPGCEDEDFKNMKALKP